MKTLYAFALTLSLAITLPSGAAPLEGADKFCTAQYNQCLASLPTPADKTEDAQGNALGWNAKNGDKTAALKLKGDIARGKKSYEICSACHLRTGSGLQKINIPQIAGQHSTVVIKQLSDLRVGIRYSPTMEPFASTLKGPQDLADLAAYIETLCIPAGHGKYEGIDANQKLAEGKAIFSEKCKICHGVDGGGDKDQFYPVIAGQHYQYLVRQLIEIRDGLRRNSDPDMVKALKRFSDNDRVAVSAYMAGLNMAGKSCPVVSALNRK